MQIRAHRFGHCLRLRLREAAWSWLGRGIEDGKQYGRLLPCPPGPGSERGLVNRTCFASALHVLYGKRAVLLVSSQLWAHGYSCLQYVRAMVHRNSAHPARLLAAPQVPGRSDVAGSLFWFFAVLGASFGYMNARSNHLAAAVTKADLVITVLALIMVRALVHGIRLAQ